jgi:SAM-dependent methyltransferase
MEIPYLQMVTQLAPAPGKVLDVGCGSGEPIARYFVEHGYQVTGVDAVNEMLDIARTRFPDMTWRQQKIAPDSVSSEVGFFILASPGAAAPECAQPKAARCSAAAAGSNALAVRLECSEAQHAPQKIRSRPAARSRES